MKTKKTKIAIDIDFLLRDWISSLINIYRKQIDEDYEIDINDITDITNLYKLSPFPKYDYIEQVSDDDTEIVETILVVDENEKMYPNEEYFNKFMIDNILEIFGYAKEVTPNIFLHLNDFSKLNKDKIDLTLFSKINGKGRSATCFFLSKCSSEISNIKFISDYKELKSFDYIFTHTNISKGLSIKNTLILFKTPFNGDIKECTLSTDIMYELNEILIDENKLFLENI